MGKRVRGKATLAIHQKEALWKDMVLAAQNGDLDYLKLVAPRLWPTLKPVAAPINFDLDETTSLPDQAKSILKAISTGKLDPEMGCRMLEAMAKLMTIIEIDDLQQRIEALESNNA